MEQLDFEPSINSSHIGISARDGVITLSGRVHSLREKRAAEKSAGQVQGVKAVVDQTVVELPGDRPTSDEVVAERAHAALASNDSVPTERIHLSVEKCVVTLRGDVDWQSQRRAAEGEILGLDCVAEIRNEIVVKPPIEIEIARDRVREALNRVAPLDVDKIDVRTDGSRVKLSGTVNSWHEKDLAESATWSIPGVTGVINEIAVV
jgi:osmotically-inducible protein OsmY